jgi:hypothetical protein
MTGATGTHARFLPPPPLPRPFFHLVQEQEREKALGKVGLHMLPGMAEGDGKDFTVCEKDGRTAPMP